MPKETRTSKIARLTIAAAIVAYLVIVGIIVLAGTLESIDDDLYYRTLQEDGTLEWATFWAFVLAALISGAAGLRQWRAGRILPWFLFGVAAFCLFVAGEEISWGQRILGYRPPQYFLAENFQQELNIHNVVDTGSRKLALKGVILGYGLVLPVLGLFPAVGVWFRRLGVVASPVSLAPAFVATYALYEIYPWEFTGETVELLLGLGFLFAALAIWWKLGRDREGTGDPLGWGPVAVSTLVTVGLGAATAAAWEWRVGGSPELLEAVRVEARALAGDFTHLSRANRGVATRCGLHKRVYSFKEKYRQPLLDRGDFVALVKEGMPEPRATFFIDPWNTPYWIRHECARSERKQISFVYSFGPNRRRDSSSWEILGDDIGVVIFEVNIGRGSGK